VRRISTVAADIRVCRYTDGVGHPFWFSRNMFGEISRLHGDKGVWKLIESGRYEVGELRIDGPVPLDVDTWEDYQRLLATAP
jgi:molybdenum cofactor cytidylyltransferase